MAPECPAHYTMDSIPADGRRRKGRPNKTWQATFSEDTQARGFSWSKAAATAAIAADSG